MITLVRDRQWDFAERRLPKKSPQGGDIVISSVGRPPLVYCLSEAPGLVETTYADYDEALTQARHRAKRERVDVWFAEEAEEVMLVSRHRPDGE
jgi:hypothetical protein